MLFLMPSSLSDPVDRPVHIVNSSVSPVSSDRKLWVFLDVTGRVSHIAPPDSRCAARHALLPLIITMIHAFEVRNRKLHNTLSIGTEIDILDDLELKFAFSRNFV